MVVENYTSKKIMEISGAGSSAVSRWRKQYQEELQEKTPEGTKAFTPDQQRIQELEEQLRRATRDNEILKKANDDYKITELGTVFNAKLNTYYYQQQTKIIKPEMIQLIATLKAIATETNNSYGRRRMNEELQLRDYKLGIYKTASVKKKNGIVAINPKKKHYYPDSGVVHEKAPNVLKWQFNPGSINTHWVRDITYIRTHQGWSYLASVLDLGSREIVGFALSEQPNAAYSKKRT